MKVYLDVCCLNRPFDDQVQDRVRLESEAVLSILNHSKAKGWRLLNSEVINIENLAFKPFDALHIACAEKGKADILLTTDDGFLRKASQCKGTLKVKVENPVRWLMEVIAK